MEKNLSWFLGPKAENASTFEDLLHVIVNDCFHWRKNYFPDDPLLITKSDQRAFDEEHDKLYQNVHEFLAALRRNFPFYNPRYIAHMLSDVTMPSLLGYIGGLLYNPNNVTTEAAPVTTEWEIEACNQILQMIGYKLPPLPPKSDSDSENYKNKLKEEFGWAHICSGGSLANIEALWVARCVKYLPLSIQDTIQNKLPDLSIELKSPSGDKIVISGKETYKIKKENGEEKKFKYDEYHLINIKPSESIYLLSKYIQAYVDYVNKKHSSDKEWKMDIKKVSKEAMDILKESPYSLSNNMGNLLSKYPLAIFVSGTAHYSIHKAADLLGIGRSNIKFIDIEPDFRMSMSSLKKEINRCYSLGISPLAVIGIVGTTEEGAIDPIHRINDIRKEFEKKDLSFWVHVDSAWGGYCKSILQLEDEQFLRIKLNKVLDLIDLISKSNIDYYKDIHEGTEIIKNSINDIIKRNDEEVLNEKILKEIATTIPELFDKDGNFSENEYDKYYNNVEENNQIIINKVNHILGLLGKNIRLKKYGDKSINIHEGIESIRDCIIVIIKKKEEEALKEKVIKKDEILNKIAEIIPELFDENGNFIEIILEDYSKKIKENNQIIKNKVNQILELLVNNKCLNKNGITYVDIREGMDIIKHSLDIIIKMKKEEKLRMLPQKIQYFTDVEGNIIENNVQNYRNTIEKELKILRRLDKKVPFDEFMEKNNECLALLPYLQEIVNQLSNDKDLDITSVVDNQIEIKETVLSNLDSYFKINNISNDISVVNRHIDNKELKSAINSIPRLYIDINEILGDKDVQKDEIKKELNIGKDDRVKELSFYTNYLVDISYKDKIYGPLKLSGNDDSFVCSYLDFKNADSVTIDPHKMGYIPYPCGVIAFKNDRIRHLIAQQAPYITSSNSSALVHRPPLHANDDETWENSNNKQGYCIDAFAPFILEGSKPGAAAASLWLTNKCIPLTVNGYGKIIRDSLLSARALYTYIKKWNEFLDRNDISASYEIFPISNTKPDTNVVVFAVKRKFLEPTIENMNVLTNKIYQKYSLQVEMGNREYSYGQPFFLSKTTFSYPFYTYSAMSVFFDRVGIKCTQKEYEEQGITVLRATLMNPYLWAYKENRNFDFINDFMINMHNELEEMNKEEKLKRENKISTVLTSALNTTNTNIAIQLFDIVIKEMPDSEVAYTKRGDLYAKIGKKDNALNDYSMAISIKPNDGAVYYKRAITYYALNDLDKALKDATKAIKFDKNYHYIYTRGAVLMAKGCIKDAKKAFDEVLSTHNDYLEALENRAKCCRLLSAKEKKAEKKAELLATAENDEKKAELLKKERKS